MARVIVGLSGGVDSAVAASLLKAAGHDVVGVTLRTWEAAEGEDSRCCDIDAARAAARKLGIPFYALNCVADFREKVIRPFIRDYLRGLTPNPCVVCNRQIKWERLLYIAAVMRADLVATGHYASVAKLPNGRWAVQKALHAEKDQSYMLYRLTQEQLASTLMPLGRLSKAEVRHMAEEAGLSCASRPDSQEVCFVTEGHYADYIKENADTAPPGEGLFLDESGRVLGRHRGVQYYTVGQRRGLGLALGYPAYVKSICADRNRIVIGKEASLYRDSILCRDVHYMGLPEMRPGERTRCTVKVRCHHREQGAWIEASAPDRITVAFDEPVRAAAPGQSAVFYSEEGFVLGGGIIACDE